LQCSTIEIGIVVDALAHCADFGFDSDTDFEEHVSSV